MGRNIAIAFFTILVFSGVTACMFGENINESLPPTLVFGIIDIILIATRKKSKTKGTHVSGFLIEYSSSDLDRFLKRHYKLTYDIEKLYSQVYNDDAFFSPDAIRLIAMCEIDIAISPVVKEAMRRQRSFSPYYTFERLAIIYERQQELDMALEVCYDAVSFGFTKETKGDTYKRIKRLKKLGAKLKQEKTIVYTTRVQSIPFSDSLRIFLDSDSLVEGTKKFDVFLHRYSLMVEKAEMLRRLKFLRSSLLLDFVQKDFPNRLRAFIESRVSDIMLMKTAKGRMNNIQKLSDSMKFEYTPNDTWREAIKAEIENLDVILFNMMNDPNT